MTSVEKLTTAKNVELAKNHPEFIKLREVEQKFIVSEPNRRLEALFLDNAVQIEQIYISSPNDEFSLRVRKTGKGKLATYTATLKDRGEIVDDARSRLEIDTPISKDAYTWFAKNNTYPRIRKKRAEPLEGLVFDFYDGSNVQIAEVEHHDLNVRQELIGYMQSLAPGHFVEVTGNAQFDNESLAYNFSRKEIPSPPETLDAFSDRVAGEMVAQYVSGKNQVILGLTGMSGSGKTTVTKAIQEKISQVFNGGFQPIVISTDDYHFGKKALEQTYGAPWTEWDDPRTYNTAELAADLSLMKEGFPLIRRHFDFATEEVVFDDEIAHSPFVIIEGLYAGSKDLESVRDLHFELPTSIATSIGRDVRRLAIENRANRVFPNPQSRFQYQLEKAIKLYSSQERPQRNNFSASIRPLADRALYLDRLIHPVS